MATRAAAIRHTGASQNLSETELCWGAGILNSTKQEGGAPLKYQQRVSGDLRFYLYLTITLSSSARILFKEDSDMQCRKALSS